MLDNKKYLFLNIKNYLELKKLNILNYLPLTFHIKSLKD